MTTITTDMLKQMADRLGVNADDLQHVLWRNFRTSIDDTPADTEEQAMGMTITYQQMNDLAGGGLTEQQMDGIAQYFGYTITPAKPPAEMVKLAREIAAKCAEIDCPAHLTFEEFAALAALQQAVNVVKGAPVDGSAAPWHVTASITHILNALGAGGRDAG